MSRPSTKLCADCLHNALGAVPLRTSTPAVARVKRGISTAPTIAIAAPAAASTIGPPAWQKRQIRYHHHNTRQWPQICASACRYSSPVTCSGRCRSRQTQARRLFATGNNTGTASAQKQDETYTASDARSPATAAAAGGGGPLPEYERRVDQGRLRDDTYQRGGCASAFLLECDDVGGMC